jgi:type IV pilus assembly protein PilF
LYEQKDFKKAAEQLDRAAGFCLKDQFDEAIYYGALSHYQVGAKSQAEARLEELLNLYPNGKYGSKAKSMLDLMRK